ncbi:substrate-binding domain-containing protein [Sinomonas sp. P10A9]|uniref:Substrate-binding domain-containing protein n=1 Tax=Sinomonas puerhi TaxID=3238584 RepID=A0AB39L3U9_9MICC
MAGRRVASRAESKSSWRARRRRSRFAIVVSIAVGVLVLIGLAAWALVPRIVTAAAPSCASTETYSVLADSTTLPAVNAAAARVDPAACVTLKIDVAEQTDIAAKVAAGKAAPDLWLADSSARVSAVNSTPKPEIAVPSVAASPAVVVAAKGTAAPSGWGAAFGTASIQFGDPLTSASASAALAGAVAEGESGGSNPAALAASLGKLAQGSAQKSHATQSDSALLDTAERSSDSVIVAESSWLAYASSHQNTKLAATVPGGKAAVVDYPIAVTSTDSARRPGAAKAAKALAAALGDDQGRRALADAGLRAPGAGQTDGAAAQLSVGAVTVLAPSADGISRALKTWALQVVPFRSLVVMDVSGSMNLDAGGKTRMQLTQQAAATGAGMFPDTAQLGMWAFSINLGGQGQDYKELDPIRRMDAITDGKSQRQRLGADIQSLGSLVGGGTGLYDTALAAFRTVKAGYDPRAVNSVILFTDGANEKPNSISLDELLATLNREKDPAKPVIFVTIGITADADAAVLQQIAAATGGSSYVAKDPADIPKVFTEALVARTQ